MWISQEELIEGREGMGYENTLKREGTQWLLGAVGEDSGR